MLPLIGVSMGDPAGIGPEVVLKAALQQSGACRLVVLGDLATLQETVQRFHLPVSVVPWRLEEPYPTTTAVLPVLELSHLALLHRQPGNPSAVGGEASYHYVETGVRLALQGAIQGLVTAPISKAMWHAAGRSYPGHTELLADLTQTLEVRMMLVGSQLRVILVTTHIAFTRVPAALSSKRIFETIAVAATHLTRFHGLGSRASPSPDSIRTQVKMVLLEMKKSALSLQPYDRRRGRVLLQKDLFLPILSLSERCVESSME
jgi:4-hydroxythreonine-4-phosphate dehydrogenase